MLFFYNIIAYCIFVVLSKQNSFFTGQRKILYLRFYIVCSLSQLTFYKKSLNLKVLILIAFLINPYFIS